MGVAKCDISRKSTVDPVFPIWTLCCATAGAERTSPDNIKTRCVHTRIVMETYGKTGSVFNTQGFLAFHEPVLGIYDFVTSPIFQTISVTTAHRNLHDVAGILHRDVRFEHSYQF